MFIRKKVGRGWGGGVSNTNFAAHSKRITILRQAAERHAGRSFQLSDVITSTPYHAF